MVLPWLFITTALVMMALPLAFMVMVVLAGFGKRPKVPVFTLTPLPVKTLEREDPQRFVILI